MAKNYGAFRGTQLQSSPPVIPQSVLGGQFHKRMAMDYFLAAAKPVADLIWIGKFNLESILSDISTLQYDALGASTTLSVGDFNNPAALAAAASTSSAGSRSLLASVAIANKCKPLWAQLGYASLQAAKTALADASGMVDLWITIGGAAITGGVYFEVVGCEG